MKKVILASLVILSSSVVNASSININDEICKFQMEPDSFQYNVQVRECETTSFNDISGGVINGVVYRAKATIVYSGQTVDVDRTPAMQFTKIIGSGVDQSLFDGSWLSSTMFCVVTISDGAGGFVPAVTFDWWQTYNVDYVNGDFITEHNLHCRVPN